MTLTKLKTFSLAAALTVPLILGGCSLTHQGRSVETSGFLKDYSQLQPGKDDQALLVYVDPKANFKQYTKIMLDPVVVYAAAADSKLRQMPPAELQKLVDYFHSTLASNLGEHFGFAKAPGAGVLRIRVALTEAKGAKVVLDTLSSILPPAVALNALKTMATGSGTGIGEASAEFEAVDSNTGERLAAAVDKRVGNKYTGNLDKFEEWRTTQAACDFWAEKMTARLLELQNPAPANQ